MNKKLISIVSALLCLSIACKTQETKRTQTYKKLGVTVLSFEKVTSGSLSTCPPGIASVQFKTSPEHPLALIRLKIKVLPRYKEIKVTRVEVYDSEGNKYETQTTLRDFGSPSEYECALFFAVPPDFKFKTFQFEDLSFDLEKLGEEKEIK